MARAKPKFSVLDVQRAMSGAKKAGFDVSRCDISPDGTISVVTMAGAAQAGNEQRSKGSLKHEWPDEEEYEDTPIGRWRAKRDARRAQNSKDAATGKTTNAV